MSEFVVLLADRAVMADKGVIRIKAEWGVTGPDLTEFFVSDENGEILVASFRNEVILGWYRASEGGK